MHINTAGTLDKDFGSDGVVSIRPYNNYGNPTICSVITQGEGPDRKIYYAGWFESLAEPPVFLYTLGRLNSDGTIDTSFGIDGTVIDRFPEQDLSRIRSLALQDDGKIVLSGTVGGLVKYPAFARYNSNGTRDDTFGKRGYCVLEIDLAPPARNARDYHVEPNSVFILPDGKILTSFFYDHRGNQGVGLIIRLNEDGTLDSDFNQIGYVQVMHPDYIWGTTELRNVIVQPDGKYLGCGSLWSPTLETLGMFVRYDSSGELDPAFGTKGFVSIPIGEDGLELEMVRHLDSIALQPNQRILGAGSTSMDRGMMVSIEPDGSPNIQFNSGKPLYTRLEPDLYTKWTSAAVQKDGKIVVAGGVYLETGFDTVYEIAVARFINSRPDSTFNEGKGWARVKIEQGHMQHATGVALQDDGKILISAKTPNNLGTLMRFHA